jgi:hypothetical protein
MLKPKSSQSTGCTHTLNNPKNLKTFCQKADGNCFLGQERSADDRIYATRDHSNVRSVLRNTNETALGHLEEKVWLADIWCSAPP